MKKQYFHRRNSYAFSGNGSTLWLTGAVVVIVVVLILLRSFLPQVFFALAAPLWESGSALSTDVGSFFAGIGNSAKLVQENKSLAQEILTLQNENAVLTARSQDLTSLLSVSSESGESGAQSTVGASGARAGILAGVLASPPLSPYDTLIVSSGSAQGVVRGAQVYAAGGIPIGTVTEVTSSTAMVQLLSTPGVTTNGWAGTARVPVEVTGVGAGSYTATLPAAASVSVGDSVYAPGPGAVPFGTVTKIDADPSSPTVVLHIQSLVNMFSITWVEISPTAVGT
jgi:cell shape-determining protein MreC